MNLRNINWKTQEENTWDTWDDNTTNGKKVCLP